LVLVFDDAIGWRLPVLFLHQKAIGSQLEYVGAIGGRRTNGGFDLDRDSCPSVVNEVIGPACQEIAGGEQWLLTAIPGPGVGVDHSSLRQSRLLMEATRLSEQKHAYRKQDQRTGQ
jgi:hypothetical protein